MLYWIDPDAGELIDTVEELEGAGASLIEAAHEHFLTTGRPTVIAREAWRTPDMGEQPDLPDTEPLE